jgi:hypothetical protein
MREGGAQVRGTSDDLGANQAKFKAALQFILAILRPAL